jgi:superfamily II DNA/RNA helicase
MLDILGNGRARARMPRSLILEPTRELAVQVAENFDKYGANHKLTKALLIGGVAFGDQDKALERGVDVLIATPGRLLDHLERGKILMSGIDILVIDEADRMLDMGFIPDVERICTFLPLKRQTLFFSATMPGPVKKLADRFLKEPKSIEVSRPASASLTISQSIVLVSEREKRDVLRALLQEELVTTAIIFCNRKRDVKAVYDILKRARFSVAQLHGDMEQSERLVVMERFKAGAVSVLVASDVAARGLDISQVSHVFNYDVPLQGDDYVHRIGRTGRAGRTGTAVMLVTPADQEHLQAIQSLIGQKIPTREKPAVKEKGKGAKVAASEAAGAVAAMDEEAQEAASSAAKPVTRPAATASAQPTPKGRKKQVPTKHSTAQGKTHSTVCTPEEIAFSEDGQTAFGLESHVPAFFLVSARSRVC